MFKSKERYNEYMRNYYRSQKMAKFDTVKNNLRVLFDYATRKNDKHLVKDIINLHNSVNNVILPKYKFEVPQDILDFLDEEIPNSILI